MLGRKRVGSMRNIEELIGRGKRKEREVEMRGGEEEENILKKR